ncbi:MAG: 30S ribosome-binding factor RbfA [Kiloniellaceae bacterium]
MAHSRSAKGRGKASPQGSGHDRSQRQLRVGEELRHALARVLARGELRDPNLAGASLTVTEVRISPDLKAATAFVVPLGGGDLEAVIAALNHAAGFLRGQLGQEVQLRHTPRLSFQADHSFDEAARINALLHHPRVARDVEAEADEMDAGERGTDEEDADDGR